jgi:hypothetical protein
VALERMEGSAPTRHACSAGGFKQLAGLVGKGLVKAPSLTVATLFGWTSDPTNLGGGREATVHDFACACLFYAAPVAFDQICEGAAERLGEQHMLDLLVAVAEGHWTRMRERVTEWIDRPERQQAAETLVHARAKRESGLPRHELVTMLVRLLDQAADLDVQYTVAGALATEPELAERVWPLLLQGYLAGTGVSA